MSYVTHANTSSTQHMLTLTVKGPFPIISIYTKSTKRRLGGRILQFVDVIIHTNFTKRKSTTLFLSSCRLLGREEGSNSKPMFRFLRGKVTQCGLV